MTQKAIEKQIEQWRATIKKMPEKMVEQAGEEAMEFISDYPLYVSGTSNITYEEAILIALVMGKEV